jgi:hypothetical protein
MTTRLAKLPFSSSANDSKPRCPTKLFIGGISRNTTTKTMKDHFSQHGRVLDCIAMRQQTGRSRGFGYVTLDSLDAAQRCIAEPQVIDSRVLDVKLAVPENAAPHGISTVPPQEPHQSKTSVLTLHGGSCLPSTGAPHKSAVLACKTSQKVPKLEEEDLLVFAEDYVSFLEDQETFRNLRTQMPSKKTTTRVVHLSAIIAAPETALPVQISIADSCNRPAPPSFAPPSPPVCLGAAKKISGLDVASSDSDEDSTMCTLSSVRGSDAAASDDSDDCDMLSNVGGAAKDLPSLGSSLHASGECRRCNFFARGRCGNGKDCTFCHLPHEGQKKSRQEKRERRAAWLQNQEEAQGEQQQPQQQQQQQLQQHKQQKTEPDMIAQAEPRLLSAPPGLEHLVGAAAPSPNRDDEAGALSRRGKAAQSSLPAMVMIAMLADYSDDDEE